MTASFADWFSDRADEYARFRPLYPEALFEYLAARAPGLGACWDCGTGNGQAAICLAEHFERVVATDASPDQLAHARAHQRVEYRCEPSERTSIEAGTMDLVAAAASLHWFDLLSFYAEVKRVLRPGGLFAAWTYDMTVEVSPAVDRVIERYAEQVLGPYWLPQASLVRTGYRTVPFPFAELEAPPFAIEVDWGLPELIGVLGTWSAANRYHRALGRRATAEVEDALVAAWTLDRPREASRRIRLPLRLRLGRVEAEGR